ncbi:hypothetical protein HMPREF0183_1859 [Brevibacterium mcbrellneri ATCC 49030]|uniref:Uncharacterized protein n=1 Tax=Brevibacterium mcbrellneri ATCC 49030 TaxID=585530 RepID=D4YPJ9_9MICO|nr:DUF6716 putative glycosyltransferase [Brevibacterium mcbrellneri]EFG46860.1 hypothetical protein HMPREF0183_1859 [Brevibacterium mcbrellneri ATCC 49030]
MIAIVESPLQFLAALETHKASTLFCYDSATMRDFVEKLPLSFLADITVKWGLPPTRTFTAAQNVIVGDLNSGSFQLLLVRARGKLPALTVVDDGRATITAFENVVSKAPLVRSRVSNSVVRTGLGHVASRILYAHAQRGHITWFTALTLNDSLRTRVENAGVRIESHSFSTIRSFPWDDLPTSGPFVIGSAMVADGVIDEDSYFCWLENLGLDQFAYIAHRRESSAFLNRVGSIPGATVYAAGLPVEIRLSHAQAGSEVYSLPTTATETLPLTMDAPKIKTTFVPDDWWKPNVTMKTKMELNTAVNRATTKPILVSISDSESYLKWSASLLDQLREDFDVHVWLVDNPILPTGEQIANALAGSDFSSAHVPVVKNSELKVALEDLRPDVILAAATGPIVQVIYSTAAFLSHRPGLVSGLPGVGLPATSKGQRYRRLGDMFITHSAFEKERYEQVLTDCRFPVEVVVARLPMLKSKKPPRARFTPGDIPTRLVFAPQAKVPVEKDEREQILLSLNRFARNFPKSSVIVKVRSRPGEQETHHEEHSYTALLEDLEREGKVIPGRLSVEVGPMSDFLEPGTALATVSSTAALESLDRGLATLIIADFGVNEDMLNEAFADSGIAQPLSDLERSDFRFPSEAWLTANYFQPFTDELPHALQLLAKRARAQQLPDIRTGALQQNYRGLRATVRSRTPKPVVQAYRLVRREMPQRVRDGLSKL